MLSIIKNILKNLYYYINYVIILKENYRRYLRNRRKNKKSYYEVIGFNKMYNYKKARCEDYPILFHLSNIINHKYKNKKIKIFDFGGSCGISNNMFETYVQDYSKYIYMVCEDSATVEYCKKKCNSKYIHFTTNLLDCESFDILVSIGTLQVAGDYFLNEFKKIKNKPKIILLGHIEVTNSNSFYSLTKNGIVHFTINEEQLKKYFFDLGYQIKDDWNERILYGTVLFHSDLSIMLKGYYFER